jgi:hypothetical protein
LLNGINGSLIETLFSAKVVADQGLVDAGFCSNRPGAGSVKTISPENLHGSRQ